MNIIEQLQDTTRISMMMPTPVIAAVHGCVLGARCEWAMNCDLRIAAEETKFGFPEVRVGLTITNAGTKMLPLLVGLARAKEMIFTTNMINAVQAESWGLINKVVPLDELESEAMSLAKKITRHSTLAIAISKKTLNQSVYLGFEEALNQESRDIMMVFQTMESTRRAKSTLAAIKKSAKGRKK